MKGAKGEREIRDVYSCIIHGSSPHPLSLAVMEMERFDGKVFFTSPYTRAGIFSDIPQSMITVESFIINLKHPSPYPWKILPATCLGKGPNLVPTQGEGKKLSIPHAFVHHETKFNKNTNGEHFA